MPMRLNFSDERVLAIVAHPDDAELLCAGTLARAAADGAPIAIAVLCQGEKGQSTEPVDNLSELRLSEMTDAAALLRAVLIWGGVPDGTLCDSAEHRRVVLDIVREFRPSLILAHSRQDYHPDHRAAGELAEAVSWLGASRGHVSEHAALSAPPALWWMDTVNMHAFEPEFYIDVSEFVSLKQRMLACHQSQLQRGNDQNFSPLQELMHRQMSARGAQSGVAAAEAFRSHPAWKRTSAW